MISSSTTPTSSRVRFSNRSCASNWWISWTYGCRWLPFPSLRLHRTMVLAPWRIPTPLFCPWYRKCPRRISTSSWQRMARSCDSPRNFLTRTQRISTDDSCSASIFSMTVSPSTNLLSETLVLSLASSWRRVSICTGERELCSNLRICCPGRLSRCSITRLKCSIWTSILEDIWKESHQTILQWIFMPWWKRSGKACDSSTHLFATSSANLTGTTMVSLRWTRWMRSSKSLDFSFLAPRFLLYSGISTLLEMVRCRTMNSVMPCWTKTTPWIH
mmetsp:Transcript_42293/g.92310  ORF Transcript_42293/g.92310 Transcript_42293/m.92310 type:complete len:273 (-) Transcript_42293:592-1410(-)